MQNTRFYFAGFHLWVFIREIVIFLSARQGSNRHTIAQFAAFKKSPSAGSGINDLSNGSTLFLTINNAASAQANGDMF
jgi:hypothetical protein